MSARYGPLPGVTNHYGTTGLGVLGAVIRATTSTGANGPGLLYNDWQSGDDGKEFRALIVTPPGAGTLTVNEDGSFSLTGAPDGAYTLTYRLYVDGADLGTETASFAIGAGAGAGVVTAAVAGQAAITLSITVSITATGAVAATVTGIAVAAGRYCTQLDLQSRFGSDELVQITNPTDPSATTVDMVRVADAIDDIDALIDAKLQARYALPMASVPRVLRNIACDLVRARLYEDRITEHVAKRETAALKLLDEIAAGKLSLGLADNGQATAPADGPQFVSSGRVFTPASLADYAP